MDMTRRQFAMALAAATYLRPSLFEPLSPLGVPRGVVPGRVTWAHDPAAVTWDGTGSWWTDAHNDQSVIDRMVSRPFAVLQIKKATPRHGTPSFNTSIALMVAAKPDTVLGRRLRSRRT